MTEDQKTAKAAHSWERDPDNWYVENTWVSRRLFEVETFRGRIVDPCAGMGNIMQGAKEAGTKVYSYDLRDRGFSGVYGGYDFLNAGAYMPGIFPTENIVSNFPYGKVQDGVESQRPRLEEEFVRIALERTTGKVAAFLDANWMAGSKRGQWLETLPLYRVYVVSPRPSCPPGTFLQRGGKAGNGSKDYCWYVFLHGYSGSPTVHWLRRDDPPPPQQQNEAQNG
jgi:hypothetical protein